MTPAGTFLRIQSISLSSDIIDFLLVFAECRVLLKEGWLNHISHLCEYIYIYISHILQIYLYGGCQGVKLSWNMKVEMAKVRSCR